MAAEGNQNVHERRAQGANGEGGQQGGQTEGAQDQFAERDQQRDERFAGDQRWQGRAAPVQSVAAIAVRGTALLLDTQWETARTLWRAQARNASMFGAPDFSEMFESGDDRGRRLFSQAAEQLLGTLRQATDTMLAVQQEMARLAERQAIGIAEDLQRQLWQLGQRTDRGLRELRELSLDAIETTGEAAGRDDTGDEANDEDRERSQRATRHQPPRRSEQRGNEGGERSRARR